MTASSFPFCWVAVLRFGCYWRILRLGIGLPLYLEQWSSDHLPKSFVLRIIQETKGCEVPFGESPLFCHSCRYRRNSWFSRILSEKISDTASLPSPWSAFQTAEGNRRMILWLWLNVGLVQVFGLLQHLSPPHPTVKVYLGCRTKITLNVCQPLLLVQARALLGVGEAPEAGAPVLLSESSSTAPLPGHIVGFGHCCYFSFY